MRQYERWGGGRGIVLQKKDMFSGLAWDATLFQFFFDFS